MNQVMRVNDHLVVWAVGHPIQPHQMKEWIDRWQAMFGPDPKIAIFADTQIVERRGTLVFEFMGDVSKETFEMLREWWKKAVDD